jgi:transcriptional regulator with XRE-family HTH domain
MKLRFGQNLARCREGADVSQEELSFRASIHRTEVSLLERGERMPRVDHRAADRRQPWRAA